MTDFSSNKNIFLAISAVLTGQPVKAIIASGRSEEHFQTLIEKNSIWNLALFYETSAGLLRSCQYEPEKLRKMARHHLLEQSPFKGLGRNLCILWETGTWPEDI